MQWLDTCGPPGVGKSTLCDFFAWESDPIETEVAPPPEWHDFFNEVTRLFGLVRDHPSFVAVVRMNRRTVRKMSVVAAMDVGDQPYIQTGFVQRGLGFGWRLVDMGKPVEELYHFFRLMPASLGVVFLEADEQTLTERNKAREKVKETSHENRAFMAPLMAPAIEFAKSALSDRGVPFLELRTDERPIDETRERLVAFANERAGDFKPHIKTVRPAYLDPRQASSGVATPPVWW